MDKQIKTIIELFHKENPIKYTFKEICLKADDSRWIIFVDFPKDKFVIKIAANNFTSKERVTGWLKIIAAYKDLGYYSPAILKSINGNYSENIIFNSKSCIVWEEEYAKYHLYSALDKSVYTDKTGRYVYHNDVLAFIGKAAQKHYDFFPYKSGFVRFEPFGDNEVTDEVSECVKTLNILVKENAPQHIPRWEKIYDLFMENRQRLAGLYSALPTSVFQSDHFRDNLLLDETGHLMGVIDYNLAGCDTCINVFLYTVLFGYNYVKPQINEADMLPEYNPVRQDLMIQSILDSLDYIRQFYTFNEAEAYAILPLYKYISCIEYTQINAFKKYKNDDYKLNLLFDAIEHELIRSEDGFYRVMLHNSK